MRAEVTDNSRQYAAVWWRSLITALVLGAMHNAAATLSIVACERDTGVCGVAVATHNLAVGSSVPFAKYAVGAGVSQFETNPCHKDTLLRLLPFSDDLDASIEQALAAEEQCPDGMDASYRQIAVVSANGIAAAHTGTCAGAFAGHRTAPFVSVQGNGLQGDSVLTAMLSAYQSSSGPLAERLLAGLVAGHDAGGQSIGVSSAALLVTTQEGWPVDIDLRVDFAPVSAVSDLVALYDRNLARQLLFRAAREDDAEHATALVARAVKLAPDWDRIALRAARLSRKLDNAALTNEYACRFNALNSIWAQRLTAEFDFSTCIATGVQQP
ncbi:MAG: DUF1028 domain-containing protein [Pseudomonadota bacterium]